MRLETCDLESSKLILTRAWLPSQNDFQESRSPLVDRMAERELIAMARRMVFLKTLIGGINSWVDTAQRLKRLRFFLWDSLCSLKLKADSMNLQTSCGQILLRSGERSPTDKISKDPQHQALLGIKHGGASHFHQQMAPPEMANPG